MGKYFLNSIIIVAFILIGVNATFANDDGFHVQSLNVDNSIKEENSSSINMQTKKLPQPKQEVKVVENTYILTPQEVYPYQTPYGYNNNIIQYKIGPYYTTGINRGFGFNYKGFGYNYTGHGYNYGYSTSNRYPIYVAPPPPPPHMHRPQKPMHKPNGGAHQHREYHH